MKTMAKPLQPNYMEFEVRVINCNNFKFWTIFKVCTLKKVTKYEHLNYPAPTCGHGNATAAASGADETVQPSDFTMAVIVWWISIIHFN
jgi:hypothetical protein